jgi:hypothetical protein
MVEMFLNYKSLGFPFVLPKNQKVIYPIADSCSGAILELMKFKKSKK